jgi:hypothetical protein
MLVTAENKMRDAREITQSYDGELVQTLRFPFGDSNLLELMQKNLEYTRQMLSSLGPPTAEMNGRPGWSEVPVDFVQEFLDNFWVMEQTAIHPPTVRSYIHAQTRQGELIRWRVLVSIQKTPTEALGTANLGIERVGEVGLINRSRLGKDPTSLGVITDPDDELFGLSDKDIADADEAFANGEFPTRGKAYRSRRDPREGLLILYPISGNSIAGRNARNRIPLFGKGEARCTVIGFAVSFPSSTSPATVTYIQGPESGRP